MTQAELLEHLPDAHKKHLDPASAPPIRMMAARGLAPLPPREMAIVLAGYTLDPDAKLAEAARAAFAKLPDKIAGAALESGLPAAVLSVLAPLLVGRDDLLERLVLARETPNDAIAEIAAAASERIAEIISNNQERCMQSEAIVRALRGNPNILRSSIDRLFDFLVRAGVIYEDMPEYGEAMARLSPTEMAQTADKISLPPEVVALTDEATVDEQRVEAATTALESPNQDDNEQRERERTLPMYKLVSKLNVAQKVALAIRGNKEARAILVRDRNRVVASAAVRNPRITEQELISAAQSRTVSDEVVRIIATTKDMTRPYGVKLALVGNPKTPLVHAMRLLTLLHQSDVKQLAKSKNVPAAVANQARRLLLNTTQK